MIKIIYEQKENRAAAYDDEKFIGESTYAKSDKVCRIFFKRALPGILLTAERKLPV